MHFPDLVSNMKLIAVILDTKAEPTFCNDYFLTLTGWTRAEVLGCDWFERFVPTGVEDLRDVFSDLLKNLPNAWHHENEILCKSGEKIVVRWHNSVIRESSGPIVGIASIGEDVTEHRLLERERLESSARERRHLCGPTSRWARAKPVRREPVLSQPSDNGAQGHATAHSGFGPACVG